MALLELIYRRSILSCERKRDQNNTANIGKTSNVIWNPKRPFYRARIGYIIPQSSQQVWPIDSAHTKRDAGLGYTIRLSKNS